MFTERMIISAQSEVTRLASECAGRDAFAVSEQQLTQACAAVRRERAAIRSIAGPVQLRAYRTARYVFLRARLLFGASSSTSQISEWLLGFCSAVICFVFTVLTIAACGTSAAVGMPIALASLAVFLAVFLLIPRYLPATAAISAIERQKAEQQARLAAIAERKESLRPAVASRDRLQELWDLQRRFQASKERLHQLEFNAVRNRLLRANWRALRGIDFEEFLVQVFTTLGFAVQTTKASGDQGVDLKASRRDMRLAVQAKGYVASVGNSAIQEVYAGMVFHGCNRCMVVTNSIFTSGAKELAAKTGCLLVDEQSLPDLITGKIL